MTDYGEPWHLQEDDGKHKIERHLVRDRDNKILKFTDEEKQRMIDCVNFSQEATFDAIIVGRNWREVIDRLNNAQFMEEQSRENFDQLQLAYKQLMQDFQNLSVGCTRMGLNPEGIMSAEAENRRNGV